MRIARTIIISSLLLGAAAPAQTGAPAPTAPATPPPPPCRAPEHRQFDFWVGTWDLYRTGTDTLAGRNRIESIYNGCVIRETWTPARGAGGSSFNSWLPHESLWRQTWVDGSGSYAVFDGRYEGDQMVLTGVWRGASGPGSAPWVRTYFSRLEGDRLRQRAEASMDNGQTWAPLYDFTYRRVSTAPAASPAG